MTPSIKHQLERFPSSGVVNPESVYEHCLRIRGDPNVVDFWLIILAGGHRVVYQ
jgi:hypothetical protein